MSNEKSEPRAVNSNARLNSLRAAVLGANDGIVSVAGIVVGVAGATNTRSAVFTAGLAGLIAGAVSMAAGEYVSVSSQRDTERTVLALERKALEENPEEELEELAGIYQSKGLSAATARRVAKELTEHDAFKAHADAEHNIDPNDLNNPWQAAFASALAFLVGAIIPLLAATLTTSHIRIVVTFIAVMVSLTLTGILSARFSRSRTAPATIRVILGGALAMIVTYGIGTLVGSAITK